MPIHIDIYINERYVKSYHIGRAVGDTEPDSVNTYWIVEDTHVTSSPQWSGDHAFLHRYGDGLDVCIQKGLVALNGH